MKKKSDVVEKPAPVVSAVGDEHQVPMYLLDGFAEIQRDRVGVQGLLQYAERRFRELGVQEEAIWNKIFSEAGISRGTKDIWQLYHHEGVIRLTKKAMREQK